MSDHEGEECEDEDWGISIGFRPLVRHLRQPLEPVETELVSISDSSGPPQLHRSRPKELPQRTTYRPVNQNVTRAANQSQAQCQQAMEQQIPLYKLEAATKFYRGAPEDDFFTFQVTWETLVLDIARSKSSSAEIARNKLDEICRVTEAWIPTPAQSTNRVAIWGSAVQVRDAKILLEGLERQIRANREKRPEKKWNKINPNSAAKEAQLQREEELKRTEQRLDQLGDQLKCEYEGYLILPEHFDLEKFSIRYRKPFLLPLQRETSCRIRTQVGPKCICLGADYEDVLQSTLLRVRQIVAEFLRGDQCLIVNYFLPPSATDHRDRVRLMKNDKFSFYQVRLEGESISAREENDWNDWQDQMKIRYRNKIKGFVEKSLTGMQTAQKHILMRMNFASLGFSRCQLPASDKGTYAFNDFLAMVAHPFTKVESCNLQHIEVDPGYLVANLRESKAFGPPTTAYALQLDHTSRNNVTLRYEVLSAQSFDKSEYEQAESRWTQFRQNQDDNLLEVNMMRLGSLGMQFEISGQPIYDHSTSAEHKIGIFVSNIKFEAASQGITAHPRRRWHIPPNDLNLTQVSEITMARFPFRDTSGIFELRRRDVYPEAKKSSKPMKSILSAHYYYPEWDSKLKELGSMKPGQEASWTRSVDALFPTNDVNNELGALPRGFKIFMEEVEEVRSLLETAIEKSSNLLNFD